MQRYDIINWLIEKYGYKSYLEVGVAAGECFKIVKCDIKHGVEPQDSFQGLYQCTSDEYFAKQSRLYDIILIDGDHTEGQVLKDINNSLKHLSEGGTIVVHDCNPPTLAHTKEPGVLRPAGYYVWNGTVWKAWVKMRMLRADLACRCVDADWGCGIIQVGDSDVPPDLPVHELTFDEFDLDRDEYLNLITVDQFKEIYSG